MQNRLGWAISQLFWLLLSLQAAAIKKGGPCEITAPHITLGDAFALEASDNTENTFTISVTITSSCSKYPGILLRGNSPDLAQTLPSLILAPFDHKAIDVLIEGVRYHKKTLFFSVDRSNIDQGYSTWELRRNKGKGSLVHTIEKLPPLALKGNSARLFVIADMDESNAAHPTWTQLNQISAEDYDMIIHVGDFAYEIETDHGQVGDEYFQRSSLSGRRIPYLMVGGNHENFADGMLLNYRFRMPTASEETNAMYDFVYKGVYYMFINLDWVLEFKSKVYTDHFQRELQLLKWMQSREKLLKDRKDINWKVFLSHRPFECSDAYCHDCKVNGLIFRRIADQSAKMGFHLMVTAHSHAYVRHKLFHGLEEYPVTRVGNGVYLTVLNGHAGVSYWYHTEDNRPELWAAFVERLDVSAPTFLRLELSADRINGTLLTSETASIKDQFELSKEMISGLKSNVTDYVFPLLPTVAAVAIVMLMYLWLRRDPSTTERQAVFVGGYELAGNPGSDPKATTTLR